MEPIIGISLELQEKILRLVKTLTKEGKKMTGAIIFVERIGYGFCWGLTSLKQLESSAEYFRANDLKYKFSVVKTIVITPAGELMDEIHRLNKEAELPGILKFLELQKGKQKAA